MTETYYLAIDLGATSGRTILACFDGQKITMKEFTRFRNPMIPISGNLHWNLPGLYYEILLALRKVAQEGIKLQSIGIDTWGCDFAFFDKHGHLSGLPYCYRDSHTEGAQNVYFERMSAQELYKRTGIQFMDFNSVFQLDTLKRNGCTALESAEKILFIPDALIYMLTGNAVCEYTVASTSQMLDPETSSPRSSGASLNSFLHCSKIHSPEMFLRNLVVPSRPPSLVKLYLKLSLLMIAFGDSMPMSDHVPQLR